MPSLAATYDLIGVAVRVEVAAPAAARVRLLLAGSPRTRRAPDTLVRLVRQPPGLALYEGERLVQDAMTPSHAVSMVMWLLNRVAAGTTRYVVIHAGCVALDGRGIVLPGPMGSGKSTLVTALVLEGFRYLSDELAPLDPVTGRLHPYPRPIVLEPGSFRFFPQLRPSVAPELDDPGRWLVSADEVRPGSRGGPVPPGAIVFSRFEPGAAGQAVPVSRSEAVTLLADQTLNLALLGNEAVAALGRLALSAPAYRLTFGDPVRACAVIGSIDLHRT